MAISFVNSAQATSGTLLLPTGIQAGDYIIIYLHRNTTGAPGLASGYTNIANQSANANAFRVMYKVAVGTESGTSVIPTNTNSGHVVIYRGVAGIGGAGSTTNAASTSTTVTGIATFTKTDGTSWAVSFAGSKQTTSQGTITGTTTRGTAQAGTSEMSIIGDSNGGVSTWGARSSTNGTSATGSGGSFELVAANIAPAAPTLLTPADSASVGADPAFTFSTTDPEGNPVTYEIQIDTANTFDSQ